MPLQNRVAPDGSLHAVPFRGTLTGNRGVIHDPLTRSPCGRRWTTRAWIACALNFRGVRRDVWGLNRNGKPGWSELFFLDEVTALAAGHRPCFYCRRADALRFARAFGTGNKMAHCTAPAMDAILHGERLLSTKGRLNASTKLSALPDGVVLRSEDGFFAVRRGKALPWRFSGYGPAVGLAGLASAPFSLVTPHCVVAALMAGYAPAWHESAGA